jgi:hypothetical protein
MSALARQGDRAAPRLLARRSAAGRSRRADDGALTEMARSLLRDARESRGVEGEWAVAPSGSSASRVPHGTRSRRRPE